MNPQLFTTGVLFVTAPLITAPEITFGISFSLIERLFLLSRNIPVAVFVEHI